MKVAMCADCSELLPIHARGLCQACYKFVRDGREKPRCGTVEGWRRHRIGRTRVCELCEPCEPNRAPGKKTKPTVIPRVIPEAEAERLRRMADAEYERVRREQQTKRGRRAA